MLASASTWSPEREAAIGHARQGEGALAGPRLLEALTAPSDARSTIALHIPAARSLPGETGRDAIRARAVHRNRELFPPPECSAQNPVQIGCAKDSSVLENERAFRPFGVLLPQLTAAYVL
jgi:hypothetical protein